MSENTDRTVISTDGKQTVEVYKINFRNNHKIKAGIGYINDKAYLIGGYQAGKFEGLLYSHNLSKLDGGSLIYTLREW